MNQLTQVHLQAPYLLFIGEINSATYAKTAAGLVQWCPEKVGGQLRFAGNPLDLGVPDMSVKQAAAAGIKSIVVGVAPVGGQISQQWIDVLIEAAQAGLDIVSGMHRKLSSYADLVLAAEKSNVRLIDIRVPSNNFPVAQGLKRQGKRLLMVGTDCAVGKKYTALAVTKALQENHIKSTFRATGQTGIMIAGQGIPIDSVVSDFVSGAAELLSPNNDKDHWDVIEGQGSIFNPSYSAVSLGLLHGSQPDAFIVCHDPSATIICSCPEIALPNLKDCIELTKACGKIINPAIQCLGVSVNSSHMNDNQRQAYFKQVEQETGVPCFDPLISGCDVIVQQIIAINQESICLDK